MKKCLFFSFIWLVLGASTVRAESDYDACYNLLKRNENAKAVAPCTQAADQGNLAVRVTLGNLYNQGVDGLDRDYGQAAKWFRKAAVEGEPTAQYLLGTLYELGHGVPQDIVEAYAWMDVGTRYGDPFIVTERDALVTRMSNGQLAEALERSAGYRDMYGKNPRRAVNNREISR